MGKFNDVLDTFGEPGEDGSYTIPGETFGSLVGAYDEDMLVPAGELEALSAANADLNTQLAALKSKNAELLLAVPSEPTGGEPNGREVDDREEPGEDEPSIDAMFEKG